MSGWGVKAWKHDKQINNYILTFIVLVKIIIDIYYKGLY